MNAIAKAAGRTSLLHSVEQRVLWLAVYMIHYANFIRPNKDGAKIGGHQSSSASVVTVLTSLYFDFMRAGDLISVKPHASPVFHAIQYLLGNLHAEHLADFRKFHGLQSYPSQTKDPDTVDFSTGSVGIGAVAPNFASLVEQYIETHGWAAKSSRRYITLLGDAELDEGSIWEAIAEPMLAGRDGLLWVVDLNRQSLDRIIPGIRVRTWREMLEANGWQVLDVKYGARMKAAFELPNGDLFRTCIDELSNETYQALLRVPAYDLREWLLTKSRYPKDLKRFLDRWEDAELRGVVTNLGGHDFEELHRAYAKVDGYDGPTVIFAYTMKGWQLPTAGHPLNHSALLTAEQIEQLRINANVDANNPWAAFDPQSEEGRLCSETGHRLREAAPTVHEEIALQVPNSLGSVYRGKRSTQQSFGTILTALSRECATVAERMVTISPDVASSTNLGGWINRQGVWNPHEVEPLPKTVDKLPLNWKESNLGNHVELGISENNLFMALGQFGLSYDRYGRILLPVGTLYDPFVRRGLDAFFYSVYVGSKFIVVGTPSGVTLSAEGGAHQSILSPSIGVEMPETAYYEPCFGQELEWIMLDALQQIVNRSRSTYLRLSTKPVDQDGFALPETGAEREVLRKQVLNGAYCMKNWREEPGYKPGGNVVNLFAAGAIVPEAVKASQHLREEGIFANIISVTGPGPLFDCYRNEIHDEEYTKGAERNSGFLTGVLFDEEKSAPAVTVMDGHPHSLAWIGSALGVKVNALGVSQFGQSGDRESLYRDVGIDVRSIVRACRLAVA